MWAVCLYACALCVHCVCKDAPMPASFSNPKRPSTIFSASSCPLAFAFETPKSRQKMCLLPKDARVMLIVVLWRLVCGTNVQKALRGLVLRASHHASTSRLPCPHQHNTKESKKKESNSNKPIFFF